MAATHLSRMRRGQCLQEAFVRIGGTRYGSGLQPLLKIGCPINDAATQLAVNWTVPVESHFRERAFRKPYHSSGITAH